jgi:hypothetical protein
MPQLLSSLPNPARRRILQRGFYRVACRPGLSLILIGTASLFASILGCLFFGIPQPGFHDEHSYLLAADTFAHGRLANPTHPMWVHFESFHIIHEPTYASKYPPAQGLMLALGQILTGQWIVGVWLSTALACGAIYWMLRAWFPPRWALLGGLLAVVHPTVLDWSQSYWGGSVAMFGGALVLGSAQRLGTQPRLVPALLLGVGLAVLANSRPYEGLVLTLVALAPLLLRLLGPKGPPFRWTLRRIALPVGVILALNAIWMGYYNLQVTGNVWRLPYQVHEAKYAAVPSFLCQESRSDVEYRHPIMRDFWTGWVLDKYQSQQTLQGFILGAAWKWKTVGKACLALLLFALAMFALPWALTRDRRMRLALIQTGIFGLALLPTLGIAPHYAAPAMGLVFILGLGAIRRLRLWRVAGEPIGRPIVAVGLFGSVLALAPWMEQQLHRERLGGVQRHAAYRAKIVDQLNQEAGRHLVIVHYRPGHLVHAEWVYNRADIDAAKVVLARDMGETQDRRLLEYFHDRQIWLVEADAEPPRLRYYLPISP